MELVNEDTIPTCMFTENSQIKTCITQMSNGAPLKILSAKRFKTVVKQSKRRKDVLHTTLNKLNKKQKERLRYHDSCVLTYTSNLHIKRSQNNQQNNDGPAAKRRRRSDTKEFIWKQHCLFCAKSCPLEKDPKHPDRWKEAFLCKTSDRDIQGRGTYRNVLLSICDQRNDAWADEVRLRLNDSRAFSDLHAADGRYHEKCRKSFTATRNIIYTHPKNTEEERFEEAFNNLISTMLADKTRMWTSLELQAEYVKEGGVKFSRKKLIESIRKHQRLKDDILVLWSTGFTSLVVFRCHANVALRIQEIPQEEEYTNQEDQLRTIAKSIESEIKVIARKKKVYKRRIDIKSASEDVSPTFSKLLSMIDPKELNTESLPSILLGNIVTSVAAKRFTQLTVSLAVMVAKKKKVMTLAKFGAVYNYDELLRFRTSNAKNANVDVDQGPLRHFSTGLVQGVQ